jgi:single-strand DNA-binding protein
MDDDYGSSAPAPRQSSGGSGGGAARPAARPAANFSDMDDDIPF